MTTPAPDIFELVLARGVATEAGEHESLVHLWWRAPLQGPRVVQVYVDAQLVDATDDPAERERWLVVDRTLPHVVALQAVDAADAWTPTPLDPIGSATLTLLRDERLPVDTRLHVSLDGAACCSEPVWPSDEHRGGFGALFGMGGFGTDAATGPGLGLGELGLGPLGADNRAWRWRRTGLPAGDHALTVTALDAAGRTVAASLEATLTVDRPPPPPLQLSLSPDFTLTWSL